VTASELKRNEYLRLHHPALWLAINHHKTHKNEPISFENRHYLEQLYLEDAKEISIIKSTQSGISEWLWLKTLGKAMIGRSVFYVLPTIILKNQFVRDRIDRSILFTPYYKKLIKAGERASESMSLKHVGLGGVAFIGSNSAASFTSYAADDVVIDELDQCDQRNLQMAPERLSASPDPRILRVSNPTIEGVGIDEEYARSDKRKWYIKHDCGEWLHPDFFQHVVRQDGDDWIVLDSEWDRDSDRDIRLICDKCGKPFDRFAPGEWVATGSGNRVGYHISKMFSTNTTVAELLDRFDKGLTNDTALQRFYNGDLGLAFTAEGAKISRSMIEQCVGDYRMEDIEPGACVMGVDVGKLLHIRVNEVLDDGTLRAVYIGTGRTYTDIRTVYRQYKVRAGVIDANPERRLSKKVCATMPGMWMCFYGKIKRETYDARNKILTVPRTPALDAVKEQVMLQKILYPKNVMSIEGFVDQMTAATRVWKEDQEEYVWDEGSKDDHYMHAESYSLLGKRLLAAGTARKAA
jgi:hypothetical protein